MGSENYSKNGLAKWESPSTWIIDEECSNRIWIYCLVFLLFRRYAFKI